MYGSHFGQSYGGFLDANDLEPIIPEKFVPLYKNDYATTGEFKHGLARYLLFEDPFLFLGEDSTHLMIAEQGLESESLTRFDSIPGAYSFLGRNALQWEDLFLFLGEDDKNIMQPEQAIGEDIYKESNITKGTFTT